MASVFGVVGESLLCRRNFLFGQIINKVRKYTSLELFKQFSDQPKEVIEALSPFLEASELTQDLCFRVRDKMISQNIIPEDTIDTRILDICLRAKKFTIARGYVKCLESNGYSINVYALARYLELYETERPITKSEESDIVDMVERIQKEWEHVPPVIIKTCIINLCKTHKWKKALEFFGEKPFRHDVRNTIGSHLIPAAFQNGDISLGLKLLEELTDYQDDGHKNSILYIKYLNYYLQNKPVELNAAVEKIFGYWRDYDIVPTKCIIDHFVNVCNYAGWATKYVKMKRDGNCCHCGNHLSDLATNDETFKTLAKDILSKTIINKDIYQNSTPLELQKFKNFIHKTKPYDIVIDGLNLSSGNRNTAMLKSIVHEFCQGNKKILIIGRKHMMPSSKWTSALKNVYVYFLTDLTKDDPYLLYATLMSGNNAKFITLDLLRQHIHLLKNKKIRRSFKRWQYTHQYIWRLDKSCNGVVLLEPWLCEPFAQRNNGYWHIPYRMDSEISKSLVQAVDTWICFHPPQN